VPFRSATSPNKDGACASASCSASPSNFPDSSKRRRKALAAPCVILRQTARSLADNEGGSSPSRSASDSSLRWSRRRVSPLRIVKRQCQLLSGEGKWCRPASALRRALFSSPRFSSSQPLSYVCRGENCSGNLQPPAATKKRARQNCAMARGSR